MTPRWVVGPVLALVLAGLPAVGPAVAETTPVVVDFETQPAGTTVTSQYAAAGVVFGPAPGGASGLSPVVTQVGPGVAASGDRVGDISTCPGCEFALPRTTGTFATRQALVRVRVGYLGSAAEGCPAGDPTAAGCAAVTLRALGAEGAEVGSAGPVLVSRGAGVTGTLEVALGADVIAGFEIVARDGTDLGKQVVIDDLAFARVSSTVPPVLVPPTPPTDRVPPSCGPVATRAALVLALQSCTTVEVADTAEIDLAGEVMQEGSAIVVPDGVTLRGNRSPTNRGGLLYMSRRVSGTDEKFHMILLGDGSRVTGLRLRGYNPSDTKWRNDLTSAIRIRDYASAALVDNNEIWGWPNAAVQVQRVDTTRQTADRIRVTGNFLHHNIQCGRGYGVVIFSRGYALIDRNVFDLNRHAVAGDGMPETGYLARTNLVLTRGRTCGSGYYNQHFDMHGRGDQGQGDGYGGVAGQYIEITGNTIRGDQTYYVVKTRPAFWLRGTPAERAVFAGNAVVHEDEGAAVRVDPPDADDLKEAGSLVVRNNRYGVNTALELGVGDFDGDGRQDVFQAAGAVWAYSPGGSREWHVLRGSTVRLRDLLLGDVDGDGRTDALTKSGGSWRVSSGATGDWRRLSDASTAPVSEYRLVDLDGDGRDDLFRADGKHFLVSWAATSPWERLARSGLTTRQLRFGDFDGDGRTDVFSLANGSWSVSYGGTTRWTRLNARLSSDLARLVLADMDGDGRTDVLRASGRDWQVSWRGTTPFRTLQARALAGSQTPLRLGGTIAADFTGDGRSDVLRYAEWVSPRVRPLQWFQLSDAGTARLTRWSAQNMI